MFNRPVQSGIGFFLASFSSNIPFCRIFKMSFNLGYSGFQVRLAVLMFIIGDIFIYQPDRWVCQDKPGQ
jgi:hypothetical protein